MNWSNVEGNNWPMFDMAAQDSNPGSLSQEFKVVTINLSHCATII